MDAQGYLLALSFRQLLLLGWLVFGPTLSRNVLIEDRLNDNSINIEPSNWEDVCGIWSRHI